MRRVKRVPGPKGKLIWTLQTEAERKKDNLLCNYCSWKGPIKPYRTCKTYQTINKLENDGLGVMIRGCNKYQPIMTFRPPLGNCDDLFNTFRLGGAWYNRVSEGTIVGLYDTVKGHFFGKGQVVEVHHGALEEMCDRFAHDNHLFIGGDPATAAPQLCGAIEKVYGHLMANKEDPKCSVIYIQRIGTEGKSKKRKPKPKK
jgi:hypothetical protein